jgi:hypothetical protein
VALVVLAADRVLELPQALAERSTRVGETFGAQEDERYDQQDDQVGWLQQAGKHV